MALPALFHSLLCSSLPANRSVFALEFGSVTKRQYAKKKVIAAPNLKDLTKFARKSMTKHNSFFYVGCASLQSSHGVCDGFYYDG